ncbi:alkylation response protein AidB-like acyl-CoA dehydrogenase [Paenibacillus methanolicus]|uniref:Alkylation response protein AidB-like acyl-CoA dehydrogenase n=2 Tax=Paenibacillus methanolicus TaxID=582686 RepID=A0A5S5C0W1_9BACL|nr:alkylation response protein AidB-like acyl-CoA dehydrogenase [Paenibacillus methanolicus]
MTIRELTSSVASRMEAFIHQEDHTRTLPQPYGKGLSCAVSYSRMIADLAAQHLPSALPLAMHLSSAWGLRLLRSDLPVNRYFSEVRNDGRLFAGFRGIELEEPNSAPILATQADGGFRFNGTRSRLHLDSRVHVVPVCGRIGHAGGRPEFAFALIPVTAQGVALSRHTDALNAEEAEGTEFVTGDVRLQDVFVPASEAVLFASPEAEGLDNFTLLHRLHVSAIYAGIARSALASARDSAKASHVPQWGLPLSRFPGTQFLVADAAILLETCESQLVTYGSRLNQLFNEQGGDRRLAADTGLLTMEYVVDTTHKILQLAMKITGISSIRSGHPLANLYATLRSPGFDMGQTDSANNRDRIAKAILQEAANV